MGTVLSKNVLQHQKKKRDTKAEAKEELMDRNKRVVKARLDIARLESLSGESATKDALANGDLRKFVFGTFEPLVDSAGRLSLRNLLMGLRTRLRITPIEISNAQIATVVLL